MLGAGNVCAPSSKNVAVTSSPQRATTDDGFIGLSARALPRTSRKLDNRTTLVGDKWRHSGPDRPNAAIHKAFECKEKARTRLAGQQAEHNDADAAAPHFRVVPLG